METLGALCDKLTIIKLKQWHTEDQERTVSLLETEKRVIDEINEFVNQAIAGVIPLERLKYPSNKVYNRDKFVIAEVVGNIGEIFSQLSHTNCKLWHEQEKVYEFDKVPLNEKDTVIKNLAILNLERTKCIDEIDNRFSAAVQKKFENMDIK